MTETPEDAYRARGNDYLRDQLSALDSAGTKRLLNNLTLLEIRCRGCGDAAFAVVATRPYWVVRVWATDPDGLPELQRPPQSLKPVERGRALRLMNPRLSRQTRHDLRAFVPIATERRRENAEFVSACRCQTITVSESWLWDQLDKAPKDGQTRRVTVAAPPKSNGVL